MNFEITFGNFEFEKKGKGITWFHIQHQKNWTLDSEIYFLHFFNKTHGSMLKLIFKRFFHNNEKYC